MKKLLASLITLLLFLFISPSHLLAAKTTNIDSIPILTSQIESTTNKNTLQRLYTSRARNHANQKQFDLACEDIEKALAISEKGYLLEKLANYSYRAKDYKGSYVAIYKTKTDYPNIYKDIKLLEDKAVYKIKEEHFAQNPLSYTYTQAGVKRRTRFDVIREMKMTSPGYFAKESSAERRARLGNNKIGTQSSQESYQKQLDKLTQQRAKTSNGKKNTALANKIKATREAMRHSAGADAKTKKRIRNQLEKHNKLADKRAKTPFGKKNETIANQMKSIIDQMESESPAYTSNRQSETYPNNSNNYEDYTPENRSKQNTDGHFDNNSGQFMIKTDGGYIGTMDGRFRPKVSGGYIDPQNGNFTPTFAEFD